MTLSEETALVKRAKSGNKEALGLLFESLTPKLYGYLLNTLKDRPLAEDIVQQTWIKATTALPRFELRSIPFGAWLFAIAKNECRQHWRKHTPDSLEHIPESEHAVTTTEQQTIEHHILIDQLLAKLSPEDQEILRLRYIADLSFEAIAAVATISSLTARVRLHRALKRARIILQNTK